MSSFSSSAALSAGALIVGAGGGGAADALGFCGAVAAVVVSVAIGSGGAVSFEHAAPASARATRKTGLMGWRKTSRCGVEVKYVGEISDKVRFQACRASCTSK